MVVGGDDDDVVDALGLELVPVLDVGRDVLLRAGRREGARDADQGDLLVLELFAGLSDFSLPVSGRGAGGGFLW